MRLAGDAFAYEISHISSVKERNNQLLLRHKHLHPVKTINYAQLEKEALSLILGSENHTNVCMKGIHPCY